MPRVLLEICVDSPDGLAAAVAGGADRIELCSALDLGGLTPSPGLMRLAARAPVPVYAMIRPRAGDFVFGRDDCDAMRADIAAAREACLAGVVLGASRADRSLDGELLGDLAAAATGMGRTLHRAFDLAPDPFAALELAVSLGFERILSSGGASGAEQGADRLTALVRRAGTRIAVMPGAGITAANAGAIAARTGAREIHASARRESAVDPAVADFGFAPSRPLATSRDAVAALRRVLAE